MSIINQLLSKAMSTTSDDEAIACLKMARKKGNVLDVGVASTHNGHTAEYWYQKAATYYEAAKSKQEYVGLSAAQQKQLYGMYVNLKDERAELYRQVSELRSENYKLEQKALKDKKSYMSGLIFGVIATILPALVIAILI